MIMAKGTNQEKGPNKLKTGISVLMDFGASINSHMKPMQAIPIHPRASLRFRSSLIEDSPLSTQYDTEERNESNRPRTGYSQPPLGPSSGRNDRQQDHRQWHQ